MLWIVDGGMISLPVVARVEDFKEDSYIEITGADENHEWKSEPTRYEAVTHCKDCKYCYAEGFVNVRNVCEKHYDFGNVDDNWFCADGERRDPCSSQDS